MGLEHIPSSCHTLAVSWREVATCAVIVTCSLCGPWCTYYVCTVARSSFQVQRWLWGTGSNRVLQKGLRRKHKFLPVWREGRFLLVLEYRDLPLKRECSNRDWEREINEENNPLEVLTGKPFNNHEQSHAEFWWHQPQRFLWILWFQLQASCVFSLLLCVHIQEHYSWGKSSEIDGFNTDSEEISVLYRIELGLEQGGVQAGSLSLWSFWEQYTLLSSLQLAVNISCEPSP